MSIAVEDGRVPFTANHEREGTISPFGDIVKITKEYFPSGGTS
jgi:hypothetical protein